MPNLKERFERFMSILPGVEHVDALMEQCNLPGRQRADYLAFNRSVIIEQKSLDVDPDYKVPEFFEKHTNVNSIGDADLTSLSHILRQLPDGTKLGIGLYRSLTKGLDDILSKADKQTRDTRKTFLIPQAIGVVVILNDNAQTLDPDVLAIKAFEMLRKRSETQEIRYRENHVVILICEAHRIRSNEPVDLIPTATIFSEAGGQSLLATDFAESLLRCWAEFNKASYTEASDCWSDFETRDPAKNFTIGGSKFPA